MKISKIILLSYTALIVIILSGFLIVGLVYQDKATASNHEKQKVEFQKVNVDLEPFSYLHLAPGCRLTIQGGDESQLFYHENGIIDKILPQYEVRNDTLFITSTKSNRGDWLQLEVSGLNAVEAQKSNIRFEKLVQETLVIDAKKTSIVMVSNSNITYLQLQLSDQSKFNGSQYNGSSISLGIDGSQVAIHTNKRLKSIDGTATGNSNVRLPKSLKINLESDQSSKVVIQ